jgi:pimeloyl-ACP methyl ester carboxylesterase
MEIIHMIKMLSTAVAALFFVTACAFHRNWTYDQSLGLGSTEHLIWAPYDVISGSPDHQFPLYFFTKDSFDTAKPTVLFCAGGPGQLPRDDFVDALSEYFNVVYFHLRGSGLSQFPPSNFYDQYLRTRLAVEDIEQIRLALRIDRWHAVIGYSYGTVLAQQYAGTYGKNGSKGTDRLGKLVLIAPLSRQKVDSAKTAHELAKRIRDRHKEVLSEIYRTRLVQKDTNESEIPNDKDQALREIENKETETILSQVGNETDRILSEVERNFGNMQFLIDDFDRINGMGERELIRLDLDYSKAFFKALRHVRLLGVDNDRRPVLLDTVALVIARELMCKMASPPTSDLQVEMEEGVKYAVSYCATLDAIRTLTLHSSLTRGSVEFSDTSAATKWMEVLKAEQLKTLQDIYENEARDLNQFQSMVLDEVSKILDRVNQEFGGLQYVIMKYEQLSSVRRSDTTPFPSGVRR